MRARLLVLPLLLLAAGCSSEPELPERLGARTPVPGAVHGQELRAEGSPLRVLADAAPGPAGRDARCQSFVPGATCTPVGDLTWVLQADGGSWQLTAYAYDEDDDRWLPRLQGSGGGMGPVVSASDPVGQDHPLSLVVHGGSFDVVTGPPTPEVVVHAQGQASVEDGEVRAGDRLVRRVDGRWVSVPAR